MLGGLSSLTIPNLDKEENSVSCDNLIKQNPLYYKSFRVALFRTDQTGNDKHKKIKDRQIEGDELILVTLNVHGITNKVVGLEDIWGKEGQT